MPVPFFIYESINFQVHNSILCPKLWPPSGRFNVPILHRKRTLRIEEVFKSGYRPCPDCLNRGQRFQYVLTNYSNFRIFINNELYNYQTTTAPPPNGERHIVFSSPGIYGHTISLPVSKLIFDVINNMCYIYEGVRY